MLKEKQKDSKVRAHIFVSGIVQGVFFRASVKERAQDMGLRGWVKNLEDGRVEIVFEGKKEKIQEIIDWIKSEPGMWKIENIQLEWQTFRGEFDGFEIRY